jgi:hypothetical protein
MSKQLHIAVRLCFALATAFIRALCLAFFLALQHFYTPILQPLPPNKSRLQAVPDPSLAEVS